MDRSKRFTLFASPGRPVHSDTNSASPGSILARQQLRAKAKSLTFPPLSIARYSFIQLSEQGRQWRERKCPLFETVTKRDSNPGSLDCESGILPLSYRAPQLQLQLHNFCIINYNFNYNYVIGPSSDSTSTRGMGNLFFWKACSRIIIVRHQKCKQYHWSRL